MEHLDTRLIHRWVQGDSKAAAELYERHRAFVGALVRRKRKNDTDDVTQQTFLVCLESAHLFNDKYHFRTFLRMMALRVLQSERRLDKKTESTNSSIVDVSFPVNTESIVSLGEALETLSPELRTAICLSYWHDLTHTEIARRQGVPSGTIASRIKRAIEALRSSMGYAKADSTAGYPGGARAREREAGQTKRTNGSAR